MSQYSLGGDGNDSNSGGGMTLGGGGYGFGGGSGGHNDSSMGGGQGLGYGGTYGGGGWGGGGGGYGLTDSNDFDFGGYLSSGDLGFNFGDYSSGDYGLSGMFSGGEMGMTAPTNFSYSAPAQAAAPPTWNGLIGLDQTNLTKTGLGLDGNTQEQGFADSELGRNLRKMGLWAASQNPNTNKLVGLANAANAVGNGQYGQAIGAAANLAGVPGPVSGMLGLGVNAMQGKPVQDQMGRLGFNTIATGLGGAVAGPVGALAGSAISDYASRHPAQQAGPTPSQARNTEGNAGGPYQASPEVQRAIDSIQDPQKKAEAQKDPVGAIMSGLMGLYGINRMKGTADGQRRQIQASQEAQKAQYASLMAQYNGGNGPPPPHVRQPNFGAISSKLDAMFGPRSGAASELRTQLSRKDAAAGRRSQYGPREVQLLSELTRLRAQAEPGYMNAEVAAVNAANQGAFNVYNSQQQARQQQLQQMLAGMNMSNTGANNAQNASYAAQQASDQRTQQGLAMLYSMGRDTGAFKWFGDQASDWWNNGGS